MGRAVVAVVVFCLLACGCTSAVKLRNAATGATATCGPYYIDSGAHAEREARCISDYQRQGFERAPD
jgi:hypothetical protein